MILIILARYIDRKNTIGKIGENPGVEALTNSYNFIMQLLFLIIEFMND